MTNKIDDIYTKFVSTFHERIQMLKEFGSQFHDFKAFIKKHISIFKENNINQMLKINNKSEFLDDFAQLFYDWSDKHNLKSKLFSKSKDQKYLYPTLSLEIVTNFLVKKSVIPASILNKSENKPITNEKSTPNIRLLWLKKIKYFLSLLSLSEEYFYLETYNMFLYFVNRKLIKNGIMTLFYGSSNSSRRKNYVSIFIDQMIQEERVVTDFEENLFFDFAKYLARNLIL